MYYRYYYNSQRVPYKYLDDWVLDPYEKFKGTRWFHVNDRTGKIDININLANKTRRKENRKLR
jgi:hypothetical protein